MKTFNRNTPCVTYVVRLKKVITTYKTNDGCIDWEIQQGADALANLHFSVLQNDRASHASITYQILAPTFPLNSPVYLSSCHEKTPKQVIDALPFEILHPALNAPHKNN